MSEWTIYAEDGSLLGGRKALRAQTAFILWHRPAIERLRDVKAISGEDGACRITYGGRVYILKKDVM